MGISVSEVAAVLNVLIIFIQFTLPLFLALIAVAIVENTNNAATWSVFGQLINSTKWPSLLRTDSASKRRVSKRIIYLSLVATLGSVLIAVASAIAPLGLHNDSYATDPTPVPFSYVHDDSDIGKATAATGIYKPSRRCGYWIDINCPGSYGGYITFSNKTGYYADVAPGFKDPYIDTSVASNITDAFTSATSDEGNTVASVFDIHYRSYYDYGNKTIPSDKSNQPWFDQGRPRTIGVTRFFDSMIMDNKIEAIEGLVVNMVDGGIGFRNHTLPPASPYGTTWSEDLLWLEPDVVCVNLNVSLDYTLPGPDQTEKAAVNPRLTDNGGIANYKNGSAKLINFRIGQSDPQLFQRAYLGAVATLANVVTAMNKENTPHNVGDIYPLRAGSYIPFEPDQVTFVQFTDSDTSFTMPSPIEIVDPLSSSNSTKKYVNAGLLTQAYGGGDFVDINTISITTGLMLGAGTQVDASGNPIHSTGNVPNLAPLTHWTQPLFSCASALKASVKTVSFRMEGDALVSNLQVEKVVPREYGQDTDLPIWAIEKSGLMISDFNPYWGLVSSQYANSPSLQTFRSDRLYLPAGEESMNTLGGGSWGGTAGDSNAGGRLPSQAMVSLWTSASDGSSIGGIPDYSGKSSFSMFQKWASLSNDQSTVGKIISLMWTDLMANGAVGAKSVLSNGANPSATSADESAVIYDQGVRYNWLYAIPGFLLLLLYFLLLLIAVLLLCTRRISIGLLKYMLNQTSAGRAVTAERYGHREENAAPTHYWADTIGSEQVRVIKQVPQSSLGYEDVENIEMIRHAPKAN